MPSSQSTSLPGPMNKANQNRLTRSKSLRSRWKYISLLLASAVIILLAGILLSAHLRRRRRRRLHAAQLKQHNSSPCLNRASTMTHCRGHSNFSWPIPRTGHTIFRDGDEGEERQEHARCSPRNRSIESLSGSAVLHPEPAVQPQPQSLPQPQRPCTDSFAVSRYTHSRSASCVSIGTTMSDRDVRRKGYEGWPGGEPLVLRGEMPELVPVALPPVVLPEQHGRNNRSVDEGKKS
jgi:hypothetical protein